MVGGANLLVRAVGGFLSVIAVVSVARGTEITVQNDSLSGGGTGHIEAGFVGGESAAVWLTSPCNGNIVAVQVLWRSLLGTADPSVEDSITIFNAGVFPVPGGNNLALLEGPVMNDGVLNEFRYLDENNTIPLSVPVSTGQVFVVSFRFFNDPDPLFGPSVVIDNGCQAGKNAANIQGGGWVNACSLGISGDFVIRAVIDCPDQQGACCLTDGTCQIKTQTQCTTAGGNYRGNGTVCGANTCDGACCLSDGSCTQSGQTACTNAGGRFHGVASACTTNLCKGACCMTNGSCSDLQSSADCAAAGGTYKGDGTTCGGVTCSGACCYNNGTCQQQTLTQCNSGGGSWNGPSTNCVGFNCPVRGACCMPDGSCANNQLASACASAGGFYKGDNTNCTNNPCTGACCFGSCLNLIKSDCQQIAGSVWQGPFYQCAAGNACPVGACCMPLGNCTENSTPVNCASAGGVFHDGQTCAQANCPIPVGACCFNNGTSCINNLQPQQCALISGSTWEGVNSVCAVSCCPPPAGDINGDTLLNGADIQRFVTLLLGATPVNAEICKGDFNHNGVIETGDIAGMVAALLNAP